MKKIFTLLSLILFSGTLFAQSFVSTSPESKNVVLEEFTGIHCGFCPDGHVVGQGIYDQNPGDVVLINIHSGSYANPNPGEPDFRTPFGAAIDGQASVSGYPAGTVNRYQFSMSQGGGTAMSRGDWATASSQILAQPSYVNVAAQSSIDVSTRVLTVNVEGYYTGTVPTGITNKINVALLQNNVAGPQSGAASWNPGAIISGPWNPTYNHQHMFRHFLTGQWGESITNTSGLYTNTFTYTIPADLNGVAYDLFNLDVAVFIAEGNQNIVTGNMSSMTHIVPPGVNLIDLGASSNMSLPTSWCDNQVTPEIDVVNNSNIIVSTFEVGYSINGGPAVTQTVTTPLAAGATTNVMFPTVTVPSGMNNISFSVLTVAGSPFIDNAPSNNITTSGDFSTLSPTAFTTSHDEGFEGFPNEHPAPNNALLDNPQGNRVFIVDPTFNQGQPMGAYGTSQNAYRWQFSQMSAGGSAKIVWEKIAFTNPGDYEVTFDYAHAQQTSWNQDRLQVLVSTDCGITWTLMDELIGGALATSSAVSGANFYPTAGDWATHSVDLSAYNGNPDVMVAINGICGGGNNLYIDNVQIFEYLAPPASWDCVGAGNCVDPGTGNGQYSSYIQCMTSCITDISEDQLSNKLNIYPNPATDNLNIKFELEKASELSLAIKDVLGRNILNITKGEFPAGIHTNSFNTKNISNGTYFIELVSDDRIVTKKVIISK